MSSYGWGAPFGQYSSSSGDGGGAGSLTAYDREVLSRAAGVITEAGDVNCPTITATTVVAGTVTAPSVVSQDWTVNDAEGEEQASCSVTGACKVNTLASSGVIAEGDGDADSAMVDSNGLHVYDAESAELVSVTGDAQAKLLQGWNVGMVASCSSAGVLACASVDAGVGAVACGSVEVSGGVDASGTSVVKNLTVTGVLDAQSFGARGVTVTNTYRELEVLRDPQTGALNSINIVAGLINEETNERLPPIRRFVFRPGVECSDEEWIEYANSIPIETVLSGSVSSIHGASIRSSGVIVRAGEEEASASVKITSGALTVYDSSYREAFVADAAGWRTSTTVGEDVAHPVNCTQEGVLNAVAFETDLVTVDATGVHVAQSTEDETPAVTIGGTGISAISVSADSLSAGTPAEGDPALAVTTAGTTVVVAGGTTPLNVKSVSEDTAPLLHIGTTTAAEGAWQNKTPLFVRDGWIVTSDPAFNSSAGASCTSAGALQCLSLDTGNITASGSITGSVSSVSGSVGSVTGNVDGNVTGDVGNVTGTVATATLVTTATSATTVGTVTGNVDGNVTGNVGNVTGTVGTATLVTTATSATTVGTVTGNVDGNVGGSVGSVTGTVGGVDTSTLAALNGGWQVGATEAVATCTTAGELQSIKARVTQETADAADPNMFICEVGGKMLDVVIQNLSASTRTVTTTSEVTDGVIRSCVEHQVTANGGISWTNTSIDRFINSNIVQPVIAVGEWTEAAKDAFLRPGTLGGVVVTPTRVRVVAPTGELALKSNGIALRNSSDTQVFSVESTGAIVASSLGLVGAEPAFTVAGGATPGLTTWSSGATPVVVVNPAATGTSPAVSSTQLAALGGGWNVGTAAACGTTGDCVVSSLGLVGAEPAFTVVGGATPGLTTWSSGATPVVIVDPEATGTSPAVSSTQLAALGGGWNVGTAAACGTTGACVASSLGLVGTQPAFAVSGGTSAGLTTWRSGANAAFAITPASYGTTSAGVTSSLNTELTGNFKVGTSAGASFTCSPAGVVGFGTAASLDPAAAGTEAGFDWGSGKLSFTPGATGTQPGLSTTLLSSLAGGWTSGTASFHQPTGMHLGGPLNVMKGDGSAQFALTDAAIIAALSAVDGSITADTEFLWVRVRFSVITSLVLDPGVEPKVPTYYCRCYEGVFCRVYDYCTVTGYTGSRWNWVCAGISCWDLDTANSLVNIYANQYFCQWEGGRANIVVGIKSTILGYTAVSPYTYGSWRILEWWVEPPPTAAYP